MHGQVHEINKKRNKRNNQHFRNGDYLLSEMDSGNLPQLTWSSLQRSTLLAINRFKK